MTSHSTMLHVRMDSELKREAVQALAAMGLTASEAVRLLFHRIAVDQAFPLELKVPNAETRSAMAEVDEMVSSRSAVRSGVLTPPTLAGVPPPSRKPVAKLSEILQELDENRRDR